MKDGSAEESDGTPERKESDREDGEEETRHSPIDGRESDAEIASSPVREATSSPEKLENEEGIRHQESPFTYHGQDC